MKNFVHIEINLIYFNYAYFGKLERYDIFNYSHYEKLGTNCMSLFGSLFLYQTSQYGMHGINFAFPKV
jgi:hypothetical protein